MNTFALLSVTVGNSIYVPLCVQLLKGSVTQNISTYILWILLDGITAMTIWVDGGNYALPTAYAIGCFAVCLCIWKSRRFSWTWFETTIAGMVILCIIVWWFHRSRMGNGHRNDGRHCCWYPNGSPCIPKTKRTTDAHILGILPCESLWDFRRKLMDYSRTALSYRLFHLHHRAHWCHALATTNDKKNNPRSHLTVSQRRTALCIFTLGCGFSLSPNLHGSRA